ncbi:23S rRNA (adenine(2503)-C(2))-methyltransferase RlmN [bacterium]|nr:23S rRNA (adenine(2503)-C(2))-methyltransferase RlmN [bacterium]
MPIHYKNTYLCDLSKDEFMAFFAQQGLGSGAAKDMFKALYQQPLNDLKILFTKNKHLDEKQLKIDLPEHKTTVAQDQSTKFLINMSHKEAVEAVRMPIINQSSQRTTACVSSQVGCALDCSFCITGTLGLKRNLKTWEVIEQVLLMNQRYPQQPVSNVVFMGMGEPFYNYNAIKRAAEILSDHMGLNIARKRITVSTAGVVPKILSWAKEGQTNLAVSLISAIQEKRSQLMSINDRYPLSELLQSIESYTQSTGKKVLCEYILIKDLTDGQEDIEALAHRLKSLNVTVNLIPYNENKSFAYQRPSKQRILKFRDDLRQKGIFATIRWSYGHDIGAACGQLKKNI